MTAKTAIVRLFIALLRLVTALVDLCAATFRLFTAGVLWALSRIPSSPAVKVKAKLTLVPSLSQGAERLTTALTGMGYPLKDVRPFVQGLGVRAEREELKALIVEGLRALSQKAAS